MEEEEIELWKCMANIQNNNKSLYLLLIGVNALTKADPECVARWKLRWTYYKDLQITNYQRQCFHKEVFEKILRWACCASCKSMEQTQIKRNLLFQKMYFAPTTFYQTDFERACFLQNCWSNERKQTNHTARLFLTVFDICLPTLSDLLGFLNLPKYARIARCTAKLFCVCNSTKMQMCYWRFIRKGYSQKHLQLLQTSGGFFALRELQFAKTFFCQKIKRRTFSRYLDFSGF